MGRAKKKGPPTSGEFSLFDESDSSESDLGEDLPKDEIGRAKIKQQYVELLGIRIQKLAGRILNRERINKTVEGVYFICAQCKRVCHNLDEGLVEDAANTNNLCTACSKGGEGSKGARKTPHKKSAAAASAAETAAAVSKAARASRSTARSAKQSGRK